jgi:hypothetical protein
MRSITKRHTSMSDGKLVFAQVTVAELTSDEEKMRPRVPELFLNDFRINRLNAKDEAILNAAVRAVQATEKELGWNGSPLCVTRVEGAYTDRDPEAAKTAATSAATALITGRE